MALRVCVFLLLLVAAATAKAAGCDDQMGDDSETTLANLVLIPLPTPRQATPPAKQSWVAPLVQSQIKDTSLLKKVFTWAGKKPTSCSLESFTYEKLCVPKSGKPGVFRVKVNVKSSCGTMMVKMRMTTNGGAYTWGRSAS